MSVSTNDTTLRFQGALEKQRKYNKLSWNKYWFILHDDQLIYYKEDNKTKSSSKRTSSSSSQGEIYLSQAHAVKECPNSNHGFSFEIATKSRTHILSAETSESRASWIKILQDSMLVKSRRSTIIYDSDNQPITSCTSIGDGEDLEQVEEGAYDPVDYKDSGKTGSSGSTGSTSGGAGDRSLSDRSSRAPLLKELSVTGSARCASVFEDDDYSSVFNAKDQPGMPSSEEEGYYAEVQDAITNNDKGKLTKDDDDNDELIPAYSETSAGNNMNDIKSSKSIHNNNNTIISENNSSTGPPNYTYVELRPKTAIDYRKPAPQPECKTSTISTISTDTYASVEDYNPNVQDRTSQVSQVSQVSMRRKKPLPPSTPPPPHPTSGIEKYLPSYSTVVPKSLRRTNAMETDEGPPVVDQYDDVAPPTTDICDYNENKTNTTDSDSNSSDDDYDYISTTSDALTVTPDLPYPRLELTAASGFDKIRLFIAQHRGPNEIYKTPVDLELGGAAVDTLRSYLKELERAKLKRDKPAVPEKRIQSTHM